MRNLPLTFDYSTYSQKLGEDFAKFCGLLRIYELYKPSKKTHGHLYINFPQICKYSGPIILHVTISQELYLVSLHLLKVAWEPLLT